MADKFSWTSHHTFEQHYRTQKAPYLTITILDSSNLNLLLDADSINPYINLRLGEDSWETQLGRQTSIGRHFWGQTFEIQISVLNPMYLIIYDKQDYGDDHLVSSLQFSQKIFEGWKGKKEIWLRLQQPRQSVTREVDPQEEAINVTNNILGNPHDQCPLLHMEIEYMDSQTLNRMKVSVGGHRNIIINREYFTAYEVMVNRNDGTSWRVKVRYSQVARLRQEILQILPVLRQIEFPGKTYFHWLSCICRRCSKFDQGLISRRKRGIEHFFNGVLQNLQEIHSETLNNLLEIST